MNKINIDALGDKDIYSLAMLLLYQTSDIPKYSVLTELVYLLEQNDFMRLCKYFGGLTIKVPTLHEVKSSLGTVLMYQLHKIEGMEWEEAKKRSGLIDLGDSVISKNLNILAESFDKYNIQFGKRYE